MTVPQGIAEQVVLAPQRGVMRDRRGNAIAYVVDADELVYLALAGAMGWLFVHTPTGFLPDEDQGIMFTLAQAPTGATAGRTLEVMKQVEDHFLGAEADNVASSGPC